MSTTAATVDPNEARRARTAGLAADLAARILVKDGATGTLLQGFELSEADFRGERFADHPRDLRGANDVLCLTRPDVVRQVHHAYLDAGADIISTNSFTANRPSLADYALEPLATEINRTAARLARAACDEAEAADGQVRYVLGSLGPTNRTASLSPDVNDPAARNIGFEQLAEDYLVAARALVEGGADWLAIETIFDTLNAKAAIFAIETLWDELGYRVPLLISGTITDASGRTLNGQTVGAFWNTVRHARPFAVGLNCALGGAAAAALRGGARPASPIPTSRSIPTPGCPTPSAATTRRPSRPPRCSAAWLATVPSTSSAAAVAPAPTTFAPSRPWSRGLPRA